MNLAVAEGSVSNQQMVGREIRSWPVYTRLEQQTSTPSSFSTCLATHASRRSGATVSAFITATRSPCGCRMPTIRLVELVREELPILFIS